MNDKKLLALYGLKWNPFLPNIPVEDLWVPPAIESFLFRVEKPGYGWGICPCLRRTRSREVKKSPNVSTSS